MFYLDVTPAVRLHFKGVAESRFITAKTRVNKVNYMGVVEVCSTVKHVVRVRITFIFEIIMASLDMVSGPKE